MLITLSDFHLRIFLKRFFYILSESNVIETLKIERNIFNLNLIMGKNPPMVSMDLMKKEISSNVIRH